MVGDTTQPANTTVDTPAATTAAGTPEDTTPADTATGTTAADTNPADPTTQNDLTPQGYPEAILKGDVLAELFKAVQARLKALLPESIFAHTILPSNPGKTTWQALAKNGATVAMGFGNWHSPELTGATFRGNVSFPLWVMLTQATGEELYLGTGQLRGIGITGVMAALAGGLHNWRVPGIGTCCVRNLNIPPTPDWFDERSAIIWAELVFHGVSLGNAETRALLEDFITQASRIETTFPAPAQKGDKE